MLTRLRALDLKLLLEARQYALGETIDITVELRPHMDVEIREGLIDLVCEERYQQHYKGPMLKERRHIFKPGMMRGLMSDNPGPRRGTINVPKRGISSIPIINTPPRRGLTCPVARHSAEAREIPDFFLQPNGVPTCRWGFCPRQFW